MRHKVKNGFCVVLSLLMLLASSQPFFIRVQASDITLLEYYQEKVDVFGAAYRFDDFLADHWHSPRPDAQYIILAADYIYADGMAIQYYENLAGMSGVAVRTEEEGVITWEVYVAQGGLYHINVSYFNIAGRDANIQRAILINGELPYFQAASVEFYRTWVNRSPYILQDGAGNDLRPIQEEYHLWREVGVRDSIGHHMEYLSFYFQSGRNTISFLSQREPMVISHIRIFQRKAIPPYTQMRAHSPVLLSPNIEPIRIGGEDAARRSSPMLAPRANMAGPGVYPFDPRRIIVNYSGGEPWSGSGMWIEWDIVVPQNGWYKIAINLQQNFHRGAMSHRRITINGEIPFAEMEAVPFTFNSRWRVETLGGEDTPFLFYLEAGTNTLRMETVMGGYAPYIREIQASIHELTRIHRQVVMVTGVSPDLARDYQIARRIPTLEHDLRYEYERLTRVFNNLLALSGGNLSERDVVVRNAFQSIHLMLSDLDEIPRRVGNFRVFIGGLGTWLNYVREQSLSIDAIYVLSADAPTPTNGDRFFARLWHGFVSLILSFFIDFYSMGEPDEYGVTRTIEVWIGSGRDQAVILRQMINETFTPQTGIGVDLKLVDMTMLLPATVARQGPDIAVGIGDAIRGGFGSPAVGGTGGIELPMNFAFRGAVADISGFPEFYEVSQRFSEAAMVPFMYRDMVFALPETITFNMLFYRRDILDSLGLAPPDTWDDVRASIAVLDHNNMNFGLPSDTMHEVMRSFGMFLMQSGGAFYGYGGRYTLLGEPSSLTAFRDFTRFWTDYELPRLFNFENRFRSGEMPMGIADYTIFNLLQVLAPEINGLWGFRPVPGTVMSDGSINRITPSSGTAVIMMEQARDKGAAWEFMKWWTDADTQVQYGFMLEAVMGAAARHPTANLEAFGRLPWNVRDYRNIMQQFEYVQGIPQVPGGYLAPRYIRNAWAEVVINENMEARDALRIAARQINEEITLKRLEFGLEQ